MSEVAGTHGHCGTSNEITLSDRDATTDNLDIDVTKTQEKGRKTIDTHETLDLILRKCYYLEMFTITSHKEDR